MEESLRPDEGGGDLGANPARTAVLKADLVRSEEFSIRVYA